MQFERWQGCNNGWTVKDDFGREVGDICRHREGQDFKFIHMGEAFDPVPIHSHNLRQIADKLDELNEVPTGDET